MSTVATYIFLAGCIIYALIHYIQRKGRYTANTRDIMKVLFGVGVLLALWLIFNGIKSLFWFLGKLFEAINS